MPRTTRFDLEDWCDWMDLARQARFNAVVMAQFCHLSVRHLRRHCDRQFGQPTQEWLDEQRMVAARYLLAEKRSVKAVALELGFKQESHFCRQFKSCYGVRPCEFLAKRESPPFVPHR